MSKLITISSSDLAYVTGGIDGGQVAKDAMDGAEKGGVVGTAAGAGIGYVVGGARGAQRGSEIGHVVGMGAGAVVGAGASVYHQATGQ